MTNQPKTGSVTSKSGKVTARNIVTGIDIQGVTSDEVLKAAMETIQHMRTGGVSGAQGVEVSGDVITGVRLRHFDPQSPTREGFVAELKTLREELAVVADEPDTPAEAKDALESLDETIGEAEKKEPRPKRLINRLGETLEYITGASKALEAASKAGPLLANALGTAALLYQVAQTLF